MSPLDWRCHFEAAVSDQLLVFNLYLKCRTALNSKKCFNEALIYPHVTKTAVGAHSEFNLHWKDNDL